MVAEVLETHSPYTPYTLPNQMHETPPNKVLPLVPSLILASEVPMFSVHWPNWPHWVSAYPLDVKLKMFTYSGLSDPGSWWRCVPNARGRGMLRLGFAKVQLK